MTIKYKAENRYTWLYTNVSLAKSITYLLSLIWIIGFGKGIQRKSAMWFQPFCNYRIFSMNSNFTIDQYIFSWVIRKFCQTYSFFHLVPKGVITVRLDESIPWCWSNKMTGISRFLKLFIASESDQQIFLRLINLGDFRGRDCHTRALSAHRLFCTKDWDMFGCRSSWA